MDINMKSYLLLIKKRLWLVVCCVLVSTILASMYSNSNYRPIYQASTKLIVNSTLGQDQLGIERMDYGALGINLALINTYKEIIRTPAIMDKVVQRYPDLNTSTEELISIVNVSDLNETQVLTIVARHFSHDKAVKVVNAVSDVFQMEIPKIMKVNNVTILNRAKTLENPIPMNSQSNQYIIMGFIASLVVAIGIILLLEAMDDTLKTDEDIREALDVPTLALIPRIKDKELSLGKIPKTPKKVGEAPYAKTIH
ncbi:Capsular polysaccharide type 8 biosynthesis protein cap8A [compost metagenome]